MINMNVRGALTDDEIVEVITKYVDEDLYNYAIMIDGGWGCGKTYFIKNYLCGKLEEHEKEKKANDSKRKRIVYISLYGVQSVEEVNKQILLNLYLLKNIKEKRAAKKGIEIAGTVTPLAFDFMKLMGIELSLGNISKVFERLLSIKDCILIFDDLERCDCPINEILGYINTFVEHNGMKVIIVANQKEIGKSSYMNNRELKYLVAAHENISFEQNVESRFFKKPNGSEKPKPVDLEVVKTRMEELFGQNELYEKIKEKLVGITIYYYPALQKIFTELISNKAIDNNLQKLLLQKISFFERYMIGEEHLNIRTFQFFLSKISNLYEMIRELGEEGREAFLKCIIEYSFKVCVCYKKGTMKYDWKDNEEYEFKNMSKSYFSGSNLAYRFVDDYVLNSAWNIERIKNMFEIYRDEYIRPKNNELEGFMDIESRWFLSTEPEVEKQVKEILRGLEKNKYEVKSYVRIISFLLDLEEAEFPKENMEEALSKMKDNLKNLESHIYLDSGYRSGGDEKKRERFKEIIYELQAIIDERFQEKISESIGQYLAEEEGWAKNLAEFVRKNIQKINSDSGFLSQMDMTNLATKIGGSSSYDINMFRACIAQLYIRSTIGEALKEDNERIGKLKTELENLNKDEFDRIKKMQIRYLILDLDKAKESYGNQSRDMGINER